MQRRKYLIILIVLVTLIFVSSLYYIKDDTKKDSNNPIDDRDDLEDEDIGEEGKNTATILVTGDIMYHEPQIEAAYDSNSGTYDFSDNFKYVKKYIDSADLSIANFETVIAGEEIAFTGFPKFNSPKETLYSIKDAGFNVLTTVNNHALDQGKTGIINTINTIEELGMKNVGTYKEPNNDILIEKVNDINLALLSYSYGFNGLESYLTEEELSYMVNTIDEEKIEEDIKEAKELDADMVMIFIHWGKEYHKKPTEHQLELGNKMVEWGANMVFGSHPHVIQKSDMINHNGNDNYIIYSMGNFLSNQREETVGNRHTEDGVMVEIELEKNIKNNKVYIKSVNHIPTW